MISAPALPAGEMGHGTSRPAGLVAGPLALVAAAVLAGVLVGVIVDQFSPIFRTTTASGPGGANNTAGIQQAKRFAYGNTIFAYGLFGGVTGAFLALAEGVARRSTVFSVAGTLLGLVIGAGFGVLGGAAGQFVWDAMLPVDINALAKSLLVHLSAWSITGLGVGLGVSLAAWRWQALANGLLGGLLGGLAAAFLYCVLGGLLFAGSNTDLVVPTGTATRVFLFVLSAVLLAIVLGGLGSKGEKVVVGS